MRSVLNNLLNNCFCDQNPCNDFNLIVQSCLSDREPVIRHDQIIHISLHCVSLTFICAQDMFITGRSSVI